MDTRSLKKYTFSTLDGFIYSFIICEFLLSINLTLSGEIFCYIICNYIILWIFSIISKVAFLQVSEVNGVLLQFKGGNTHQVSGVDEWRLMFTICTLEYFKPTFEAKVLWGSLEEYFLMLRFIILFYFSRKLKYKDL